MLRGKVAVVLGASPLAQAIALAAARNEAVVVLASLAEKEASEVVSQARQELKRDVLVYQKVLEVVFNGEDERILLFWHSSEDH